ncbi:MAG: autotransporter domain-containing protein [Chthoniobacterales bacterium]
MEAPIFGSSYLAKFLVMKKPIFFFLVAFFLNIMALMGQATGLVVGNESSGDIVSITDNQTYANVTIGYGSGSDNNTLNVANNSTSSVTLTVDTNLYVCEDGSENSLYVSDSASIQIYGSSYLGYNSDSSYGTINLTGNSFFNINNDGTNYIGYSGANNTFSLNSSTQSCGVTIIGLNSSSSNNQLIIESSSQFRQNDNFYVGGTSTVVGGAGNIITVNNESLLSNNGAMYIQSGKNQLNILNNSTNLNNNDFHIYYGSGNVITVSNNSRLQNSNSYIGGTNNGSLPNISTNNTIQILSNSTWSNNGSIYVTTSGNTIQALVSSVIWNNGSFYIGGTNYNDSNSMNSNNTVKISSNSLITNNGEVFILSSGSQYSILNYSTNTINTNDFHIYYGSSNVVTISNNSLMQDNLLFVGGTNNTNLGTTFTSSNNIINIFNYSSWSNDYSSQPGTKGTNTVASSGNQINVSNNSIFFNQDDFCLGCFGSDNTITISAGSQLNCAANFFIGTNSTIGSNSVVTTNNTVIITGSSSTWSNGSTIYVGNSNGSSGNIYVTNGGQINAPSIIVYNGNIYVSGNNNALGTNMTLTLGTNDTSNANLVLSSAGTTSLNLNNFYNGNSSIYNINPNNEQQIIIVSNQFGNVFTNTLTDIYLVSGVSLDNNIDPIIVSIDNKINTNSFNTNINANFSIPNITGTGISFGITTNILYLNILNNANLTINSQNINETNDFSLDNLNYNSGIFAVSANGNVTISTNLTASNSQINVNNGGILSLSKLSVTSSTSSVSSTSFIISNGGQINCTNSYFTANTNSENLMIITGLGSIFSNQENIYIGYGGSGITELLLTNQATLTAQNMFVGYNSSSNLVVVSNASLLISNDIILGSNGSYNSIDMIDVVANQFTASNLFIGYSSGDSFNAFVLQNSTINVTDDLIVGGGGKSNSMVISNSSTLTVSSNVIIGFGNTNSTLNAYGNSLIVNDSILDITNTSITNTNAVSNYTLIVGENGSSNLLLISNAGAVFSSLAAIGYNSTASNNGAIVTGTNSTWINTNGFYVGFQGGNNSLLISNNASVLIKNGPSSPYSYVGLTSSNNSVIITGVGSIFSNQGALNIGYFGSYNSIDIARGGTLIDSNVLNGLSYAAILGAKFKADHNSVTIEANSSWTNYGDLYIGYSGSSNSVTNNGGTLVANNIYVGISSNTLGVPNGISNSLVVNGGTVNAANITVAPRSSFIITGGSSVNISNWLINNGYISNNGTIITGEYTNSGIYVHGALGTLTITNSSTFYNAGIIVLDPGGGTIYGHVVEGSNATIINNIVGPFSGQYGQLHVANLPLEIAGSLKLNFINGYNPRYCGHTLKILTAEDGIIGKFDTVTTSDSKIRLKSFFTNNHTEFDILLTPSSYTLMAQNANQTNVAVALDSFIAATNGDQFAVSTDLDQLTAEQYPVAFNAIMPQLYQSLSTIAFNIANANDMELMQRLWVLRAMGSGFTLNGFPENMPFLQEATPQEDQEIKNDILIPSPNKHWGVFVDGNGIFANANSSNMLPSYNSESGGVTTGLSYQWNEHVMTGLYSGYQGVYTKYKNNPQGTLINNAVRFGLFGSYGERDGKGFYLNGLAGGAYNNYNMQRNISFSTINRTATGMPGAGELDTMLATGYDVKRGNFTFGPTSSLQYLYFGANSFNEGGAGSLNLDVQGWNTSSMIYSLGSHVAYTWKVSKDLMIVPNISLNWQHQFMQDSYAINSTLNGSSPTFANYSAAPLRDTFFPSVGFTVGLGNKWDTSLFYSASAGNQDLISQNIFWSLGMRF